MKRIFAIAIVAVGLMTLISSNAHAIISDLPDINGVGYFRDESTGYSWMDIDNFYTDGSGSALTYAQMNALIAGTGFHVATLSELQQLQASAPADPALFTEHASIMGYGVPRQLIWGWYDDGNEEDGLSWSWKLREDVSWQYSTFGVRRDYTTPYNDLGLWALCTTASDCNVPPTVPEPASLSLLATGLLGFLTRRKFLG